MFFYSHWVPLAAKQVYYPAKTIPEQICHFSRLSFGTLAYVCFDVRGPGNRRAGHLRWQEGGGQPCAGKTSSTIGYILYSTYNMYLLSSLLQHTVQYVQYVLSSLLQHTVQYVQYVLSSPRQHTVFTYCTCFHFFAHPGTAQKLQIIKMKQYMTFTPRWEEYILENS